MPISPEEIMRRADALYAAREQTRNVRASIELLRSSDRQDDYELVWRLGRALFFLGQGANAPEDARALHAQGAQASARAVRVRPRGVEGRFWLGVNLALSARLENRLNALRLALRARRELERAARIDAAYHAAGPLRVLARLQHKLPRWLGGGANRARANFERAIKIAPANTVTRLYFAELLTDAGARDQARAHLDAILNTPDDPAWAFEIERDQRLALKMLQEMKG
ncbi:MAG: TRAP transporter TatT component family protein [Pyrinomonadaceae bacterium]